jgi:hypothetical protein
MKHQLDESMTRLIREMGYHDVDSEEYDVCLYNLERLSALRSNDRHRPVSLDTIVTGAVNIIVVCIIVNHERMGVLTSKALPLLMRLR